MLKEVREREKKERQTDIEVEGKSLNCPGLVRVRQNGVGKASSVPSTDVQAKWRDGRKEGRLHHARVSTQARSGLGLRGPADKEHIQISESWVVVLRGGTRDHRKRGGTKLIRKILKPLSVDNWQHLMCSTKQIVC